MNNKKIIIFIVIIITLALIVGIYFYLKNKKTRFIQTQTSPAQSESTGKTALIIVKIQPFNAHISISAIQSSFRIEKVGSSQIEVPTEKLYLTAFLPYYQNYNQEVELKAGENKTIEINLKRTGRDIIEGAPIDNKSDSPDNNLIPNP